MDTRKNRLGIRLIVFASLSDESERCQLDGCSGLVREIGVCLFIANGFSCWMIRHSSDECLIGQFEHFVRRFCWNDRAIGIYTLTRRIQISTDFDGIIHSLFGRIKRKMYSTTHIPNYHAHNYPNAETSSLRRSSSSSSQFETFPGPWGDLPCQQPSEPETE